MDPFDTSSLSAGGLVPGASLRRRLLRVSLWIGLIVLGITLLIVVGTHITAAGAAGGCGGG